MQSINIQELINQQLISVPTVIEPIIDFSKNPYDDPEVPYEYDLDPAAVSKNVTAGLIDAIVPNVPAEIRDTVTVELEKLNEKCTDFVESDYNTRLLLVSSGILEWILEYNKIFELFIVAIKKLNNENKILTVSGFENINKKPDDLFCEFQNSKKTNDFAKYRGEISDESHSDFAEWERQNKSAYAVIMLFFSKMQNMGYNPVFKIGKDINAVFSCDFTRK